jgi:hypothetical protein
MTTSEFSNQFDILYDNVASKSAPGLDEYEKSVYLTKAQLELVKGKYSNQNKYQEGFEGSEKRRVEFKELLSTYKTSTSETFTDNIGDSSIYSIPSEAFLIIQEQVKLGYPTVNDNRIAKVIPKTHDEYNIQIRNPFKKPNEDTVWRLDYSSTDIDKRFVELLSLYAINEYIVRYIKYPEPIVLTDIANGDFVGMELTIEGSTAEATSKLDQSLHDEILDRAVELAVRDYKESNLQNKVQLNLRNE